jgi:hypothetical protein
MWRRSLPSARRIWLTTSTPIVARCCCSLESSDEFAATDVTLDNTVVRKLRYTANAAVTNTCWIPKKGTDPSRAVHQFIRKESMPARSPGPTSFFRMYDVALARMKITWTSSPALLKNSVRWSHWLKCDNGRSAAIAIPRVSASWLSSASWANRRSSSIVNSTYSVGCERPISMLEYVPRSLPSASIQKIFRSTKSSHTPSITDCAVARLTYGNIAGTRGKQQLGYSGAPSADGSRWSTFGTNRVQLRR